MARPATIPPPLDLSSAAGLPGLEGCKFLAPCGRALASARPLCHKGQSQQEWTQASVCPLELQVFPVVFSLFFFPALYYLPFPIIWLADFKLLHQTWIQYPYRSCLTCSHNCTSSDLCRKCSYINIYCRISASLIQPGLIYEPVIDLPSLNHILAFHVV